MNDLVYRLRRRAEIRKQIASRKSVQEGKPDRIADLLEEAATEIELLRARAQVADEAESNYQEVTQQIRNEYEVQLAAAKAAYAAVSSRADLFERKIQRAEENQLFWKAEADACGARLAETLGRDPPAAGPQPLTEEELRLAQASVPQDYVPAKRAQFCDSCGAFHTTTDTTLCTRFKPVNANWHEGDCEIVNHVCVKCWPAPKCLTCDDTQQLRFATPYGIYTARPCPKCSTPPTPEETP